MKKKLKLYLPTLVIVTLLCSTYLYADISKSSNGRMIEGFKFEEQTNESGAFTNYLDKARSSSVPAVINMLSTAGNGGLIDHGHSIYSQVKRLHFNNLNSWWIQPYTEDIIVEANTRRTMNYIVAGAQGQSLSMRISLISYVDPATLHRVYGSWSPDSK